MTTPDPIAPELSVPPDLILTSAQRALLHEVASRNDRDHGADFLGMVLSGSVARGMATERSDLDVYVVHAQETGRSTTRSPAVDEIPTTLPDLEHVSPFASEGWWYRWSFAYAVTLLDRTGGRIEPVVARLAAVDADEQRQILLDHDRLDGWVNYAYRSLKSDRDGRRREARLDAVESIPWLLDVVFTLEGRVRPYHKYLPWELREHPLPHWPGEDLLRLLDATMDGDPAALRETYARVRERCLAHDAASGSTVLQDVVDDWGVELEIFG